MEVGKLYRLCQKTDFFFGDYSSNNLCLLPKNTVLLFVEANRVNTSPSCIGYIDYKFLGGPDGRSVVYRGHELHYEAIQRKFLRI